MAYEIGKKRNFSEYEKKDFLQMYNNGISLREIARKYNTTHNVIKNNIKNDIIQRPKSLISDKKIQEKIKADYLKGININSLVSKYQDKKISYNTIKKFLIEENLYKVKIENFKYATSIPEIYRLLESGKSLGQISANLDIPKATISNYIRLLNDIPSNYYNKVRTYNFDMQFFFNAYVNNAYELGFLMANMVLANRTGVKCVDFYCGKHNKEEFIRIKGKFTDKKIRITTNYIREEYILSCISIELYEFMKNFSIKRVKDKKAFFYGYIVGTTNISDEKANCFKFKNKQIAADFFEFLKLENKKLYNDIFPLVKYRKTSNYFILEQKESNLLMIFLKKNLIYS